MTMNDTVELKEQSQWMQAHLRLTWSYRIISRCSKSMDGKLSSLELLIALTRLARILLIGERYECTEILGH